MSRAKRVTAWLVAVGILALCNIGFAQTAQTRTRDEEKITLMTYFPSPRGVYNEMQFYPNSTPSICGPNTKGRMYMDASNQIWLCNGSIDVMLGGGGNWTLTGDNLYPNGLDWNVGIGLANPLVRLDVNGQLGGTQVCIRGICKPDWGATANCALNGMCLQYIDLADPSTARCVPCGTGTTPPPPPPPPPTITWKSYGFSSCTFNNPQRIQNPMYNMFTNAGQPIGWGFLYNLAGPYYNAYCSSAIAREVAVNLPGCTLNQSCSSEGQLCCSGCYGADSSDPPGTGASGMSPCTNSVGAPGQGVYGLQLCHGSILRCSN